MCGPSSAEKSALGQQTSLTSTLSADFNSRFTGQTGILQNLNNLWTPISEAGPDQAGFGSQELAALNTNLGEGVGANYAKATQSLNNVLAARGGGNEFLPTGASAALRGSLAASAANELSTGQRNITLANFAQGRQNWQQATAGLSALSQQYNPLGFGSEASNANQAGFKMADTISQEQNQKEAEIAGGIASLASSVATFGAGGFGNLDTTGGSSIGEQFGNFFSGGISALGGNG